MTVVFFLLAPTLFPSTLAGAGTFCYVLAVVHLAMTLLTDFPLGMVEVISFGVHGVVELVVSIALVVLPWILSSAFTAQSAQWFYTLVGVAIFAVWVLSDYSVVRSSSKTSPRPGKAVKGDEPGPEDSSISSEQVVGEQRAPDEERQEGGQNV